jgi:hypothetical protein
MYLSRLCDRSQSGHDWRVLGRGCWWDCRYRNSRLAHSATRCFRATEFSSDVRGRDSRIYYRRSDCRYKFAESAYTDGERCVYWLGSLDRKDARPQARGLTKSLDVSCAVAVRRNPVKVPPQTAGPPAITGGSDILLDAAESALVRGTLSPIRRRRLPVDHQVQLIRQWRVQWLEGFVFFGGAFL